MTDTPYKEPTDPENTTHNSQQGQQNASPILRAELQIPESAINTYKSEQKQKTRLERWKLFVEVLTLLAVISYAGIAYYQWGAMREAAQAAIDAVEIAKNTVKINKEAMEANLNQSKSALQATIDIARQDQRAWIGTIAILPEFKDATNNPIYIKEGFPAKFEVVLTNSGKSPALKVRSQVRFITRPSEIKFSPDYGKSLHPESVSVIQPQEKSNLPAPPAPKPFAALDIDAYKSRKWILYLFGKITYEDIFRIPHRTNFCFYLDSTLDGFISYKEYNDAD